VQGHSLLMSHPFQFISDLAGTVELPAAGITSKTLFNDDKLKAVIFGFAAGEELSEHTASTAAVMHFLAGQADVILGDEKQQAVAGTWIHMQPRLPHSILATAPAKMLLLLLK
jgi:quercetin dioxygenase-like cupin family protein